MARVNNFQIIKHISDSVDVSTYYGPNYSIPVNTGRMVLELELEVDREEMEHISFHRGALVNLALLFSDKDVDLLEMDNNKLRRVLAMIRDTVGE